MRGSRDIVHLVVELMGDSPLWLFPQNQTWGILTKCIKGAQVTLLYIPKGLPNADLASSGLRPPDLVLPNLVLATGLMPVSQYWTFVQYLPKTPY
jgi:hypothetical protein